MSEKLTVRRDRTVVLGDRVIGRVYGEPRDWSFRPVGWRVAKGTRSDFFHAKGDAAEALAAAWIAVHRPEEAEAKATSKAELGRSIARLMRGGSGR
jgi:hypothetical protein